MSNSSIPRMFDNKYLINGTDHIMEVFFQIFDGLTNIEPFCKNILRESACPFIMPKCTANQSALKPCREDCEYIFNICEKSSERALGAIEFALLNRGFDFYHLVIPGTSCEYYNYSYENDNQCMYIFTDIGKYDGDPRLRTVLSPFRIQTVIFLKIGTEIDC
jgi:Fz domain.